MYTEQMYENSLCHYGVKGQKWGDRRFQNLDGTYTALGERRRLETLARTGTTVRPTSALASRQQAARTGNVVRVNSVNRNTTSKPAVTTGGATKLVLDRATGTVKRIPAVTTGSKVLKKTTTAVTKPTARLVTSESSQKAKKKLTKSQQQTEETEATTSTSTSTGTKKKRSSSKKKSTKKTKAQKEAEQQAKEAEEQKAKEQEQQNQEEKKDETQNEGSTLTEEQVQDYARRVIRGEFGNGQERKDKLGDKYAQVQALVNAILLKGRKK